MLNLKCAPTMKTIGLLGGTGWSSTIEYYKILNQLVAERLGGYHSAKILLKSIDYHDIMSHYGQEHDKIAYILQQELEDLLALKPDCILICCNSLHKYYDLIKNQLDSAIPVLHAVELVADYLKDNHHKTALLLATQFTMEDGFFARILQQKSIEVVIPIQKERTILRHIHDELMQNRVSEEAKNYFSALIKKHQHLDVVILGCTEYSLVVDNKHSVLPIVNPLVLQATQAVNFALEEI